MDDSYAYTVTDGEVQITGYTGAGGVVVIPRIYDGFPVTSIGDQAFADCTGLTSISIPEGVTHIGYQAFVGCTGLTSITFNSATTSIYDHADTIPDATTIIGCDPSTAKDYATKYNRTFEVIGGVAAPTISPGGGTFTASQAVGIGNIAAGLTAYYTLDGSTPTTSSTQYSAPFTLTASATVTAAVCDSSTGLWSSPASAIFTKTTVVDVLKSIAITTPATKLTYTVGDTLDLSGLVVTGTNSDNSTQIEVVTSANVTGFNSSEPVVSQTLTISIGGKTTTYTVEIKAAPPLTYKTATIDSTNKIITLTFSDNIYNNTANLNTLKKAITFASDGINFNPLSGSDAVTLNGKNLVITFGTALIGT